ncbi:YybH family protein [Carboxylicivirga sp. N1E11]
MQREIEASIKAMMKCAAEKDIEGCMAYWSNSKDFVFIADGEEMDIEALKAFYHDFFNSLEHHEVIKHSVEVWPLGKYKAYCIWRGAERYTMKGQASVTSHWVSTLIMENKKGGWVILHGHSSHF